MNVNGVDLDQVSELLTNLEQQSCGESRVGDVSLLHVYVCFAEREERVGARIRIDNGLKTYFRFMQLERRSWRDVIVAHRANEIADQADVRIEEFCVARRTSESLCLR